MTTIIILTVAALAILYLGLFGAKKLLLPVSLLGLGSGIALLIVDWNRSIGPIYHGMLAFDHDAVAFSILCIFITGLLFMLSKGYFDEQGAVAEYYCLLLFSLIGAVLVNSFHNLAMLFLGVEIMSVAVYILVGIRKRDQASNEAAMKYFLMGAFSTGFLLFGIALIYGATGSFDLDVIRSFVTDNTRTISPIFYGGVLLLVIGLIFKVGAAPFHFWTPDVYDGAPILITAYMSTVVKIASFAGLLRLFRVSFLPLQDFWEPIFVGVALLTLFIGNLGALMQPSFKRMMAYSSISHAGYMLFAVIGMGSRAADTLLFYGLGYALATITAFLGLFLVKRSSGSEHFEAFNGLARRNPYLAFGITVAMLSLAGIPLTVGFVGKFMLFGQIMERYHFLLLIVAIVNAAIALAYYLKVVIAMYMRKDEHRYPVLRLPWNYGVILLFTVVLLLLTGIYPDWLLGFLID